MYKNVATFLVLLLFSQHALCVCLAHWGHNDHAASVSLTYPVDSVVDEICHDHATNSDFAITTTQGTDEACIDECDQALSANTVLLTKLVFDPLADQPILLPFLVSRVDGDLPQIITTQRLNSPPLFFLETLIQRKTKLLI